MAGPFRDKLRAGLRRRSAVLGLVALVLLLSAAALPFRSFNGRIDVMLPDRSELRDVFGFLRDIHVADKVLVTFSMRAGTVDPDALAAAADAYVAGLDPAWATPLAAGNPVADVAGDFDRLARRLPDYLAAEDLARLRDSAASAAGIRASLQALKSRLQRPEGMWSAVAPGADPLDWNGRLAAGILHAVSSFGYRAVPVGNHLMDPERRHLLLVLQTPVLMTDTARGRGLLEHLAARAAELPPAVEARLVCGHLHTAGNEVLIRQDVQRTALAISAVFLALFWGVYRDPRALAIMLIPMLACVPALALAAAFFESFSFIVLGFGSVIAGIAVDYGIHSYVAARSPQPDRNLAGIRRPVALSALTTLCVFIAFCFSSIPAYRQLGAFASFAIVISLVYAFWALPPFVRRRENALPEPPPVAPATGSRARAAGIAVGAVLALAAGVGLLVRLSLDPDVSKLDGTPQAVLDEEARAMAIWGGGQSMAAILVVEAPSEQDALRLNDRLYEDLQAAGLPASEISSLAPLWPSAATRQARRAAWNEAWTDERIADLRRTLALEAAALDFSEAAFAAFWERFAGWRDMAAEQESVGFLEPLRRQFVHEQDGKVRATTFVPDEPHWIEAAQKLQHEQTELRVISRRAFSAELSAAVVGEMLRTTIWAGTFILLATGLVLRRAGMLALAILPAMAGMVWGGAGMALWGLSLNVSNLVAGILVFGLCIDYGICMAYAQRRGMRRDMSRAVTLSALTTALGAAVLLIADHPAFLAIGITLVFGVSAGYLYARWVLPALQTLFPRLNPPDERAAGGGGMKRLRTGVMVLAGLWLTGCATAPFPRPEPFAATGLAPEWVPAAFAERLAPRYEQAQALVFRFYLREIAALGYLSVDLPARSFAMACLNPVGIKLFELVGMNGEVEARFVAPEIEKHGGELAQAAGTDLTRAYFDWLPPAGATCRRAKNRLVFTAADAAGRTEYRYAGRDGFLAEKIRIEAGRVRWKVEYRDYRRGADGWIPAGIVIHNRRYGYRLVAKAKESEAP